MDLKLKVKKIVDSPGIYLFYNSKKELIYVGKATSLKNRVSSYFRGSSGSRPIEQLIGEVSNIKTISTDSVLEAIILEGQYIKKYRPKYNIDWKDDKSWNYIIITKDDYPKVITLREHEGKETSETMRKNNYLGWFGPFPGLKTKETLRLLQKLFFISICSPNQKRPCLYYQMDQCLGVCTGEINSSEYRRKVINPLIKFLSGKKKAVMIDLEKQMKAAARAENFEEAGRVRNQLSGLQRIQDVALLNKNFIEDSLKNNSEQKRIEGYDISNLGTSGKVGSMVVFDLAGPIKSEYRKFNIKTVVGQSDVDCLREVLERRLKHIDWPLPDIFLIDGGLPQVNVAKAILRATKIERPIVGIAKGAERKRNDFIVIGSQEVGKWVEKNQLLLIQVRDEAHRFAINFQRQKRKIKYD